MILNELELVLSEEKETKSKSVASNHKLKIKIKDLRIFSASLSRLIRGGVPILRALEIIKKEITAKSFQLVLVNLHQSLEEGKSLSAGLETGEGNFPRYFIDMVQAGEISGTLERILMLLAKHFEATEERNRKIKEALAYPLFVLGFGVLAMAVLFQWVIPKILPVYDSFGGKLPALTSFTLMASQYFFPALILFILLSGLIFYFLRRFGIGVEILFKSTPLFGELIRQKKLYQFSSLLSLLLESGVSIVSALEAVGGEPQSLARIKALLSEGKSFSVSCQDVSWIRESQLALISAGEEAGHLPEALKDISEDAAREMESRIQILMKLLEPSLILIVGLVTGFVVLSVILPIIEMNGLVQ
ncbi:MAG: type II secretion system F family protein [Candidatus Omnitrophica bacterium]|nr:type II secretion system F family protein [Candidatus Omnitrophota bacterium]